MALNFSPAITSLIRLAQMMAACLSAGLAGRLGIGRFGHLVFLPREAHQRIGAELRYIECLTRRSLFLAAAALGALPPVARPVAAPSSRSKRHTPPAGSAARRAPRFSLVEPARPPARRPASHLHSAQAEWTRDADPAGEGLAPAAGLVRRYLALEGVFDNPWPSVARMRRLIAVKPRAIVPRLARAALSGAHINLVNRRILRALQDEVDAAAPLLDTG